MIVIVEMSYHPDWDSAEKRLRAFWNREAVGRACLGVTAPRKTPIPGPPRPEDPSDLTARWTDPESIVARTDHWLRHTYFGGESVPCHWINFGPGIMASYFGSRPVFAPGTVWFEPIDYNYDKPLEIDRDNHWWKVTKEATRLSAEFFDGKAITGITDLGGGSDVLASFRTTEGLLFDLIDNPEAIPKAMDEIAEAWIECYKELYAITSLHAKGSIQWLSLWGPGTMYNIQSDFCCMVSPAMFERFILPELQKLCRFLDNSLYHLDGPGATRHLDMLLSIPELGGIQWTPGDGSPTVSHWIPMLKKIQNAGKRLHLHGSPAEAEKVLRALKPEGVYYQTWVSSQEEADELLRKAEVWAAGPRQD